MKQTRGSRGRPPRRTWPEVMSLKKRDIPLDQLILAIPAALYIVSPLVDAVLVYILSMVTHGTVEAFLFLPYFPAGLAALLGVALVVRLAAFRDRNLFREVAERTKTFRVSLCLFALFLILMLVSIAVNGFSDLALHGHHYTKMSMWIHISNVVFYFFCSSLIYDERVKGALVKTCCVVATFYAIYSIAQSLIMAYPGGLRGTFHHTNHYGYYLSVSISLTSAMIVEKMSGLKRRGRGKADSARIQDVITWCVMLVIQCVTLGYNDSLGTWVAVFCSHVFLLVAFIAYRKRDGKFNFRALLPFAIFLCASVMIALLTTNIGASIMQTVRDVGNIVQGSEAADAAGSGRWIVWKLTVKCILEKPLFGNGISGLSRILAEGADSSSPHNEFLEYTAYFGIPAGVCYLSAVVSVYIHGLKYRKELNMATLAALAGAFGYLVSSFFGVMFYYSISYVFVFLGLSMNFAGKDRPVGIEEEPAPSLPPSGRARK